MRKGFLGCACLLAVGVQVGCVPYARYDDLAAELERSKQIIADLTAKYHQELLKNKEGGTTREVVVEKGVDTTEYDRVRLENDRLRSRLVDLEFTLDDAKAVAEAGVKRDASGALVLTEELLFPPGVAELRKGHLPALDSVASLLQTKYSDEAIIIEGHTDPDPLNRTRNLYHNNWNLGYERAKSVLEYFNSQHRIPMEHFSVVTYGYMKPVASNSTDEGKAKNRRVVIRRGGKLGA